MKNISNNQEKRKEIKERQFVSYNGVELPRGDVTDTAPKVESFADYIEDDFSKKMQEMIAKAWLLDEPVLLEGGTSLGKTTTVKKMCAELGYEVCYANLSGGTDNLDLIGKYGPNPNLGVNSDERKLIFLDGPVTTALRQQDGKIKVLVLDEYNSARPDAVIRLHEILDAYKRNGEVVLTEDGAEHVQVDKSKIKIVALTNPAGHGYLDRNPLDPAQLRRWVYKKLPNELPKETLNISIDSLFGFGEKGEAEELSKTKSLRDRLPEAELSNIPGMKEILNQYIAFHITAKELIINKSIGKDQPQRFTFDDREEPRRVRDYIARFYRGDITETIQEALRYFYADKLLSGQDKQKLEEIIRKITYVPKENKERNPLSGGIKIKKEKSEIKLSQDLSDLTKVSSLTLSGQPINPKTIFNPKDPTTTTAGLWTDGDFNKWIRPKVQDETLTVESIPTTSFTLDKDMTGEELKQKLGNAKLFTVDQIATLINNQSEIEGKTPTLTSPLDTSGKANLFLVEQVDGSVVVVGADWLSGFREWGVSASGLTGGWRAGLRVFSRND